MNFSTLTKENFWNRMYELYPDATQIFCDWIDQYKLSVEWKSLFNSDSNWQDRHGKNAPAPKFHDLPYAMQFGIWMQFIKEREPQRSYAISFDILAEQIEEYLANLS